MLFQGGLKLSRHSLMLVLLNGGIPSAIADKLQSSATR